MPLKWESINRFQLLEVSEPTEFDEETTSIPIAQEADNTIPTTNFLDLPRELRELMYEYALVPFHPIELAPLSCNNPTEQPRLENCFDGY